MRIDCRTNLTQFFISDGSLTLQKTFPINTISAILWYNAK